MKFEFDKAAQGERLFIEAEDIVAIQPGNQPGYPVRLSLRYRRHYQGEEFDYSSGLLGRRAGLRLITRQVADMVSATREAQRAVSGFCNPCYDWGKLAVAPPGCVRCQLLQSCLRGGGGDLRQAKPNPAEYERTWAQIAAIAATVAISGIALSVAAGQADRANHAEAALASLHRSLAIQSQRSNRAKGLHP